MTAVARAPARPMSRREVANAIRGSVLAAELVPGQRLVEADVCERLGAGRGAVRAALLDLTEEGLVERLHKHSARVRIVGADEAVALADLRLAVEQICVARAAERISDADIRELLTLAETLANHAALADLDGFAAASHAIRARYLRIANLPEAADTLARLRARATTYRLRPAYRAHRTRTAAPTWLALVEAICARNPDAAHAALERHTRLVQESMLACAEANKPFAVPYMALAPHPR